MAARWHVTTSAATFRARGPCTAIHRQFSALSQLHGKTISLAGSSTPGFLSRVAAFTTTAIAIVGQG